MPPRLKHNPFIFGYVIMQSTLLAAGFFLTLNVAGLQAQEPSPTARAQADPTGSPRLAFVGLHGGVFDVLKDLATNLDLRPEYLSDSAIADKSVNLSVYRAVFLQHTRDEDREQLRRLITAAKAANPQLRVVSISGLAETNLPDLAKSGVLEHDEQLQAYYGNSVENLQRLLIYVDVAYLKRPGDVIPPAENDDVAGLFHPDHRGMFADVPAFLGWAATQGKRVEGAPRACIAVHATHLVFQQPKVVAALIREFEKHGVLAVAMTDYGANYERDILEFKPLVVVHTCHSREQLSLREQLGGPHLHSIFFRNQSIDQWQQGTEGLAASELAFHVVGQELLARREDRHS